LEIKKREEFYGKNNLIWVLNGNKLANKSILKKDAFNYEYLVSISIPKSFTFVENYNFRELFNNILKDELISSLNSDKDQFKTENENTLNFKVTEGEFDFRSIQSQYKYGIGIVYENLYGQNGRKDFCELIEIKYDSIDEIIIKLKLIKRHWREFIDKMQFPVFIDNLNGLEENELYYYSENKIIDKEKFVKKYLEYT